MLDYAREIENFGDQKLVINTLDVLLKNLQEGFDAAMKGYPPDFEEDNEEEIE